MNITFKKKQNNINDYDFLLKIINIITDQYSYKYTFKINNDNIEIIFIETLYSHIKYNQYENMINELICHDYIFKNYVLIKF